ncbi:hypothetical protein CARUB_v10016288mg [Capsella rubella]|uniref:Uncharacterized protein n=1 Tax=Capsella rubella TaxID=81985 RepID=R0I8X8_9BRAS|nr:hypothetical protein CARUB_v10016288mg [Capsella rubella]
MTYIPIPLVTEIIRRVGKKGFRYLGPFIAAGGAYTELVNTELVLKDVDLQEFFYNGELASLTSIYRPFLVRCLAHDNPTAKYVESIRLLTAFGPSQARLDLLGEAAPYSLEAWYAYGLFLICCGAYEDGVIVLQAFVNNVSHFNEALTIADRLEVLVRVKPRHNSSHMQRLLLMGVFVENGSNVLKGMVTLCSYSMLRMFNI